MTEVIRIDIISIQLNYIIATSIIHLRETESLLEALNILKQTEYFTLDKTEIIKAVLAKEAYKIKSESQQLLGFRKSPVNKTIAKNSLAKLTQTGKTKGKKFLEDQNLKSKNLSDDEKYNLVKNA